MKSVKKPSDAAALKFGDDYVVDVAWPHPPSPEADVEEEAKQMASCRKKRDALMAQINQQVVRENSND